MGYRWKKIKQSSYLFLYWGSLSRKGLVNRVVTRYILADLERNLEVGLLFRKKLIRDICVQLIFDIWSKFSGSVIVSIALNMERFRTNLGLFVLVVCLHAIIIEAESPGKIFYFYNWKSWNMLDEVESFMKIFQLTKSNTLRVYVRTRI